jgi:crossover junction endonuclease MUS81
MQVPQVPEETALAVTELYPTLLSLARAYSMLVSPSSPFQF